MTLGQETINTQVYAQLDPNQCHVMTEHMQWYTLIGEAVPGGRPVKILRLAAFASNTPPSVEFSIRVYVVEDTHDALEVFNKITKSIKLLVLKIGEYFSLGILIVYSTCIKISFSKSTIPAQMVSISVDEFKLRLL